VHGDIRRLNLLFPRDSDAKIIDFDLAAVAGSKYAEGYNYIRERHPHARENLEMRTIHDCYSMAVILHSIHPNHPAVAKLKDENCSLSDITDIL